MSVYVSVKLSTSALKYFNNCYSWIYVHCTCMCTLYMNGTFMHFSHATYRFFFLCNETGNCTAQLKSNDLTFVFPYDPHPPSPTEMEMILMHCWMMIPPMPMHYRTNIFLWRRSFLCPLLHCSLQLQTILPYFNHYRNHVLLKNRVFQLFPNKVWTFHFLVSLS